MTDTPRTLETFRRMPFEMKCHQGIVELLELSRELEREATKWKNCSTALAEALARKDSSDAALTNYYSISHEMPFLQC